MSTPPPSPTRGFHAPSAHRSSTLPPSTFSGMVRAKGPIIRLRGLPYSAAAADIEAFLTGCALGEAGVVMAVHRDGRPSGEAFVTFETMEEARQALARDQERIGGRWIGASARARALRAAPNRNP